MSEENVQVNSQVSVQENSTHTSDPAMATTMQSMMANMEAMLLQIEGNEIPYTYQGNYQGDNHNQSYQGQRCVNHQWRSGNCTGHGRGRGRQNGMGRGCSAGSGRTSRGTGKRGG